MYGYGGPYMMGGGFGMPQQPNMAMMLHQQQLAAMQHHNTMMMNPYQQQQQQQQQQQPMGMNPYSPPPQQQPMMQPVQSFRGGYGGSMYGNMMGAYQNNNNNNMNNMNMNNNNNGMMSGSSSNAGSLHRYGSAFGFMDSSVNGGNSMGNSLVINNNNNNNENTYNNNNNNVNTNTAPNNNNNNNNLNMQNQNNFSGDYNYGSFANLDDFVLDESESAVDYNNNNNNNNNNNVSKRSPPPSSNNNNNNNNNNNGYTRKNSYNNVKSTKKESDRDNTSRGSGGNSNNTTSKGKDKNRRPKKNDNANSSSSSPKVEKANKPMQPPPTRRPASGNNNMKRNNNNNNNAASADRQPQLMRQDSSKAIERTYSIAGQFFQNNPGVPNYNMNNNNNNNNMMMNNNNNPNTNNNGMAGGQQELQRRLSFMPNQQQQQQPPMNMNMNMGMGMGGARPGMTLNGRGGMMTSRGGMGMGNMNMQQQQMMMMQQQKRQGRLEQEVVEEGAVAPLGRKNSQASLTRTPSRVGMYFKNVSAEDAGSGNGAEVEYKKEGDESIQSKNRAKDPSLEHPFKTVFIFEEGDDNLDMERNYQENDIELDGSTVRAMKPGNDEVSKYDFNTISTVYQQSDVTFSNDITDEVRDVFAYGCNSSLIMADADCPAAKPTQWFTWYVLRTMSLSLFDRFESAIKEGKAEFTMSVCYLQEDQSMDLLADGNILQYNRCRSGETNEVNYFFNDIVVGESPLFGNVVQNLNYMCVTTAEEFISTLDDALAMAEHNNTFGKEESQYLDEEEYGIILCTVVLKQIKTSSTTGKKDVVVSSLFVSGVGDGVVHYNRILDKNPAEPRAVFYSVLHRSVHSCAVASCSRNNKDIFTYLATLQRFSKMETRKPKLGSVLNFISYAENTIPKVESDLKTMTDPKRKQMTTKFLTRLKAMCADCKEMLENPQEYVPKTYIT